MISKARGGRVALSLAVAGAATLGINLQAVHADSYSINVATQGQPEPNTFFTGTNRFAIEGSVPGGANFTSWGLLDFSANNISNGTTTGLPDLTSVSAVNSMTLKLTDFDENFARAGVLDVYLTSDNSSTSSLRWLSASSPQGIGGQLANGSLGAPLPVGQITYNPAVSTTSNGPGPSGGTVYTTTFTLSPAMQTYLQNQLNSGGNIRVLVAPDSTTVAGDFYSVTGGTNAPTVTFDLSTTTSSAVNSVFSLSGNSKSTTINIPRIVSSATSSNVLTITNSGTDAGNYTINPVAPDAGNPLAASATGQSGVQPVASGGTSNVTVGMAPTNVIPGLASAANPATAQLLIHDRTNPSNDSDITVNFVANQVVANRLIDNPGGSGNGLDFSNGTKGILAGTTATLPVTLSTFNTGAGIDTTTNTLTAVDLPAGVVATKALSSVNTGVKDQASLAAGNLTHFTDSQSETRNITFAPNNAEGGLYKNFSFFDGFLSIPLTKVDTAIGATTSPTANAYITTNVYQQANVTLTGTAPTFTLTNALHTVNNIKVSGVTTDIGARANATVTSASLLNAQAGYVLDAGLVAGANIGDGAAIPAATFTTAGKLNGVYNGTLHLGLQNEQDIQGAAPNDLGTSNLSLSTTVAGNTGNGTANILAGGSFSGYNISRGSGKNSLITFRGGTSTSGNNISVNWGDGVATTLSDKATVGLTASDLYVVQMSYDPAALTGNTSSPVLASNIGGTFASTVGGNTGGTPLEINGAYDGNLTLGHYGIDATNHVVWAVVNHTGDFEAIQRLTGDVNGDGSVNNLDLQTVLNNFGSPATTWSTGNLVGDATIDLNDLAAVLNNIGTGGGTLAADPGTSVPEPTSLALLALGVPVMIRRRRR